MQDTLYAILAERVLFNLRYAAKEEALGSPSDFRMECQSTRLSNNLHFTDEELGPA
jgi:hypothetical protein